MRWFTTKEEKVITMATPKKSVSKTTKLLFPLVVTVIGGFIAPKGLPLLGTIMLGNFMKESGAVSRLTKASENEIANVVTLFLGISIGATMDGKVFLKYQTLLISVWASWPSAWIHSAHYVREIDEGFDRGKVNPLIGAAGISAYPMSARVVQKEGKNIVRKTTF